MGRDATCAHLFVYGTLMPAATTRLGTEQRARLLAEGTHLGRGFVEGQLVDLGDYPGLCVTGERGRVVRGDVFALNSPVATFGWLDIYEGIEPDELVPEYRRVTLPVLMHNAASETIRAWAYVLQTAPDPRTLLDAELWPGHCGRV
ncbi:MAG: gamma-glutamylcyclotransferase family protein [Pseudomonadota bacterium]